jgi:uncharacterized MnhB-related membrane protein
VDAIVETRILEYHGEQRGDLYYTKDMLLAVGDKLRRTDRPRPGGRRQVPVTDPMEFKSLVFYFLSTILVLAALRVITARNPVHSALALVLAFFTGAGLWLLLEAEFLAITWCWSTSARSWCCSCSW